MDFHIPKTIYHVHLDNGEMIKKDLDEIYDIITDYYYDISQIEPNVIPLACTECLWEGTYDYLEAIDWINTGCPICASNDSGIQGNLVVKGSYDFEISQYFAFLKKEQKYFRFSRPDYWELVIHFTKRNEFISILKQQKLEAVKTGYFQKKAVCLTEAPLQFAKEFRKRYGSSGIAFKKSSIKEKGGAPAIYMNDECIQKQLQYRFAPEVKPFINLIRIPQTAPLGKDALYVDYLHDREWRFPKTLSFSTIKPYAIILPEDKHEIWGKDWQLILETVYKFGVLSPNTGSEFHDLK